MFSITTMILAVLSFFMGLDGRFKESPQYRFNKVFYFCLSVAMWWIAIYAKGVGL